MCKVCVWSYFGLCGGDCKERVTELHGALREVGKGICYERNEPLLFVNWQLRLGATSVRPQWSSCCSLFAWGIHPQPQTSQAGLSKYNWGYDVWWWLLTPWTESSVAWWRCWQGHSYRFPSPLEEMAADTPAFRFCGAVEGMWFFTTRPKPRPGLILKTPSQPAKCL